eukprot:2476151-Pyramimonas_sp.AAC.1
MPLAEQHGGKRLGDDQVVSPPSAADGHVARGHRGRTGRRARAQEVDDGLRRRGAGDAVGRGGE